MRVRRVVIGLIAALIAGSFIAATHDALGLRLVSIIEPLGSLWVNAIRMTVVPLVASLLFVSVAERGAADDLGKMNVVTVVTFVALLTFAAVVAFVLGPSLISDMKLPTDAAAALRARAGESAGKTAATVNQLPGFAAWLTSLVPANPIKAAADGAMVPLIAFVLLLALASRKIDAELRGALVGFFRAVATATTTIVSWIILAAPIGIFALVLGAASRIGIALAGAMAYYVVAISAVLALFALLLYPVATTLGGIRLPAFTRAVLPPQIVALGSSSSLASLPALIEAGRALMLPTTATGFVLPLAVSSFKVATPITWGMGTLFLSKLYDVPLSTGSFVTLLATAVALSLSIPGVPQGAQLLLAPIVASYGIPAEGVALLIAADTIPDLIGTATNVTGDLTAAAITSHVVGGDADDAVSLAAAGAEESSSVP